MKNIFKLLSIALAGTMCLSCADTLTTSSPSTVDGTFVFTDITTARTTMLGAYNNYIGVNTNSDGFFCNWDNIASDTERCSIGMVAALIGGSQLYGGGPAYKVENFDINFLKNIWPRMYKIISLCNNTIYYIEKKDDFDALKASAPNDWTDLLGQAYALRATMYYDIARYFGDAIYMDEPSIDVRELTCRDAIIEKELAHLKEIEPLMYSMNEANHFPDQMTRNYVDGLIGRMCLMEAGYATRRTDLGADFYTDAEGNKLSFEVWGTDASRNAEYGRRSDWKKFYDIALPYLEKAVNQSAGVVFTTVDPRSDKQGREYGNPFQYYFDQVTKQVMADETVYEVTMKEQGGGSRIAYNYGRAATGKKTGYPAGTNAQCCSFPRTLYDLFDPQDMRRDASLVVTASNQVGVEVMNTYTLGNRNTGAVHLNKYDLNRQEMPDARINTSGINFIVMRQADVILMLAEAYAQTGNAAKAEAELRKVHNRAFRPEVQDQKYTELINSAGGSILEAIYKERELEFVGEGLRRWDLVRTGKMPQVAVEFRKALEQDIADMKTKGYVQYANGNQFPAYIWIKTLNAQELLGYRLTMQSPAIPTGDLDKDGLLYPGWRGQHDHWDVVAARDGETAKKSIILDNTNLAIQGLFKYIAPDSQEAADLEAAGYKKTEWGIGLYYLNGKPDESQEAKWGSEFMMGYTDADYAAKKAPIYLIPYEESVCTTTGLKNGYGFKSE